MTIDRETAQKVSRIYRLKDYRDSQKDRSYKTETQLNNADVCKALRTKGFKTRELICNVGFDRLNHSFIRLTYRQCCDLAYWIEKGHIKAFSAITSYGFGRTLEVEIVAQKAMVTI